jgi:hypothetical protein
VFSELYVTLPSHEYLLRLTRVTVPTLENIYKIEILSPFITVCLRCPNPSDFDDSEELHDLYIG